MEQPVQFRPPEDRDLAGILHFGIGSRLPEDIEISPSRFVQFHSDDPPPRRDVLLHMGGMLCPGHDDIPVIVPVIVPDLLFQPCVGIRVALDLDPVQHLGRDHHDVCPRCPGPLLFYDPDLSVLFFQKIKQRFSDIFVMQYSGNTLVSAIHDCIIPVYVANDLPHTASQRTHLIFLEVL